MKINAGNGYLTNKILKKIPPGRCLSGRAHTLGPDFLKMQKLKTFLSLFRGSKCFYNGFLIFQKVTPENTKGGLRFGK